MCGECESTLARERLQYEINVEREVLQPLQGINDVSVTFSGWCLVGTRLISLTNCHPK